MKSNTPSNSTKIYDLIGEDEGTITSISVQKTNKARYSIFLNDQFLIGISETTLIEFKLERGAKISQTKLNHVIEFEESQKIKDYLLRLQSRRDHSSRELLQKAIKKGYNSEVTKKNFSELESRGYIDDHVFARKFTHDKFAFNDWGKQKIRAELVKKGIPPEAIASALSQISEQETYDRIEHLFEKSKARFQRTEKNKRQKKLFDFLVRKGYDIPIVLEILPNLLKKME